MSIRLLRLLLALAIGLVALGALLGLAFLVHALVTGMPIETTLPLLTDRPEAKLVVLRGTTQAADSNPDPVLTAQSGPSPDGRL